MNSPDEEAVHDKLVGRNIQRIRKARGLTQAELATAVEERGVPMRQQTLVKIEAGNRPLRLSEADAIARSLAMPLDALTYADPRSELLAYLYEYARLADHQWQAMLDGAAGFAEARARLSVTYDEAMNPLSENWVGTSDEQRARFEEILGRDPLQEVAETIRLQEGGSRHGR